MGITEHQREFYRSTHTLKKDFTSLYWPAAKAGMSVPVPGEFDKNGKQVFTTYNEAGTVQLKRYVADKIVYHYLISHKDLTMGRMGRFKKDFALPVFDQLDTLMKNDLDDQAVAAEEIQTEIRAEDIKTRLKGNPSYFIDHINKYRPAFNGHHELIRRETANTVARYASTGVFDRTVVDDILDEPFIGNDGQTHTVRDYWKKEAAIMNKGVREYESKEFEEIKAQREGGIAADANARVVEAWNRKEPMTEDEKNQAIVDHMTATGASYEEVSDDLKNLVTAGDATDQSIDYHLQKRLNRGEQLTEKDLAGIEDPDLKAEWLKKLPAAGVDKERKKSFITGAVNQKTLENDATKDKTMKWRAYKDNAETAYDRAYVAALAHGADHEEATAAAQEAVLKGLDIGKPGDTSWSEWGGEVQPESEIRSIGRARNALAKDTSLIDSEEPWDGERPHIEEALRYMSGRRANIPEYYRNFPFLRRLPNGKAGTPIQIMRYRLNALGLLKDNKPLPEEELSIQLQELLRKPSPAKTLRVIQDEEGQDLINRYNLDKEDTSAVEQLRFNSQIGQQYSTTDSDYRRLVNIPQEDLDQFVEMIGELPPYMQLNNLQPEVAKAFVADTLLVE